MELDIELEITREELIDICESSIVSYTEWNNRDSYVSQLNVNECYGLLMANAEYELKIDSDTIWVNFINLTPDIIRQSHNYNLNYDDVYLYKEENPDSEMFEYYGSVDIDDTKTNCYLPTRKRLEETLGYDWY